MFKNIIDWTFRYIYIIRMVQKYLIDNYAHKFHTFFIQFIKTYTKLMLGYHTVEFRFFYVQNTPKRLAPSWL